MNAECSLGNIRSIRALKLVHLYAGPGRTYDKKGLQPGEDELQAIATEDGWLVIPALGNYGLPLNGTASDSSSPNYGSWQQAWEEMAIEVLFPHWAPIEDWGEVVTANAHQ